MGSFGAPNQDSEEKVWFLLILRFVCNFENSIILKIDHWFKKSSKTPFFSDNMVNEMSKAIPSKTDYGRLSTQKSQLSCTLLVSLHNFKKISDKMVLVERIWLVIIQIKTSTHEANIP